jgi:competence protein ComFB
MRLKNYNEDLVLDTVKIVLKDRTDLKPTRSFILDIAAYTLNRIPPKYITSERGFTRELILSSSDPKDEKLVDVIELIAVINHAVEVVSKRRRNHAPKKKAAAARTGKGDEPGAQLTYFYNLPHIFGRIVDDRDGSPVISADAVLRINDRISAPAEAGWQNPYRTNEQTKGYFSFWPEPETGADASYHASISICFSHESFKPYMFKKSLKIPGEFFVHDYIRGDKLLDLGTLTLQRT